MPRIRSWKPILGLLVTVLLGSWLCITIVSADGNVKDDPYEPALRPGFVSSRNFEAQAETPSHFLTREATEDDVIHLQNRNAEYGQLKQPPP